MKKINALILLCLVNFTLCTEQVCTTPTDCYSKAYQQLTADKEEMRNLRLTLESLINNEVQKIDVMVNSRVAEIQKNIYEKVTSKVLSIDKQSQINYQNNLENIKNKVNEKLQSFIQINQARIERIKQGYGSSLSSIVSNSTSLENNQNLNYLYKEAIIYQDIYQALNTGVIKKVGNPVNIDDTSFRVNPWNKRKLLRMGMGAQPNGNGYKTTIPEGYNVLWLRVSNHVWFTVKVTYLDGNKEYMGSFAAGRRNLNEISPDGCTPDTNNDSHMWFSIAVSRPGEILMSTDVNCDGWVSGIAFGKNLWNHAKNSALAYHWTINGGDSINWHSENWGGDQLAYIAGGSVKNIKVPVHPSGNDKLLYLIEHNSNWIGTMHTSLSVNGLLIERFRTTYDNPFARHFNSKIYSKYIAARIPKELINPDKRFIDVKIDMSTVNDGIHIYFREIGTHDFFN